MMGRKFTMSRRHKIWLMVDIVLLCVLYMGSFTDNLFHEQEAEVWNVSVIMDMAEDGTEKNFLSGLEKAARAYKMDMRYLNVRKYRSNPNKFMELIEKEIIVGCDALILGCNEKEAERILNMLPVGIPVVLVDTSLELPMVKVWFQENERDMAQKILDLLVEHRIKDMQVILASHPKTSDQVKRIHDILTWKLQQAGIQNAEIELSTSEEWATFAKYANEQKNCVIVSADTVVLETMTNQCVEGSYQIPMYGVGWSGIIRRGLEENIISAVIVPHTFETGYMAMYKLDEVKRGFRFKNEQLEIPTVVVTKDNLYNNKNTEAVLFPFL